MKVKIDSKIKTQQNQYIFVSLIFYDEAYRFKFTNNTPFIVAKSYLNIDCHLLINKCM
jgi:hypothetical protein